MDGAAVASDVVTAGTALAGLILIYIGSQVAAFEGRQPGGERNAVRFKILVRSWLAFVGFVLALGAAALAIIGKWLSSACAANAAVWVLLVAFQLPDKTLTASE